MPQSVGPHWFTYNLEWKRNSHFIEVYREESGRFCTAHGEIKPETGWWLPILDERETAKVVGQ
jgi:hypothetical protein